MQPDTFKITILGSGTSTGIPVVGCRCPVCLSQHPCNQRTRCSALLSYNQCNILIDTSTDLRQQALREDIRNIDAVFYTHSHADHLHGIDDLRGFNLHSKKAIPLYGSEQTLNRIKTSFSYIFDKSEPSGYIPHLKLCPIDRVVQLFGLNIEPIPMEHGWMQAFGYRCGPFAYLTDCNRIPASSMALLHNLELLILDGLRFTPHSTHFNIPQAIEVAQQIGAKQTLLTHLSHEVDHEIHDQELPVGINLAHDGQQYSFSVPSRGHS
ncbi:MAG: GPMC system MBL fold metallohydrolase [Deltaproteobacteria bacterium]|jgi:phosphoribosyl 1,2-cyclic phosphate phosphodiesterase|nr:GPMC system MBL fold metallohydrolase [Deltaproteobacteria bacterium]MCW8892651.1 GPMC system MBL fold metallohydrolase [Deltaproteobacteria bacterium]MCW9049476.1 GPMC system MBL fold metallohydrolase [Deltaproteobacteria bacterium]